MDEGNYDGCVLKESVTSMSTNGHPQMLLTFNIPSIGANRTVRFMLNADKVGKDGKTNLQRSADQLQRLGFNGDFENPDFGNEVKTTGTTLRMKWGQYNGQPQEDWSLGFVQEKAPTNVLSNLNRQYRAVAGAQPRPASAKPPAPTRTPPARTPPAPAPEVNNDAVDVSAVVDRDTAFNCALSNFADMSDFQWNAAIVKREKAIKRKEAAFTEDDWKAVATDLSIPF